MFDYKQINDEEALQAERLARFIKWRYNPQSVADVGCATGLYLSYFDCEIYGCDVEDFAFMPSIAKINPDLLHKIDLTKESPSLNCDVVLCLEVLEHVEEQNANAAIVNLVQCVENVLIFSAAMPGQGGIGHINCQPKEYWNEKLIGQGLTRDEEDEFFFKNYLVSGYHMGWLNNNVMIYKNYEGKQNG